MAMPIGTTPVTFANNDRNVPFWNPMRVNPALLEGAHTANAADQAEARYLQKMVKLSDTYINLCEKPKREFYASAVVSGAVGLASGASAVYFSKADSALPLAFTILTIASMANASVNFHSGRRIATSNDCYEMKAKLDKLETKSTRTTPTPAPVGTSAGEYFEAHLPTAGYRRSPGMFGLTPTEWGVGAGLGGAALLGAAMGGGIAPRPCPFN